MVKQKQILVGKISGLYGVKGWVKVFSFTEPRKNILVYSPWTLKKGKETQVINVVDGLLQGKTVVVRLEGINDRTQAADYVGWDVYIDQGQLPKAAKGEFYWSELIGLCVETVDGTRLGVVESLMETGANDVVIIKGERERVIPFLQGSTIVKIDLETGVIIVDWDPEF